MWAAVLATITATFAAPEALPDIYAVTTFESAGLYWIAPGSTKGCTVRFRRKGQAEWRSGLDLWYDARNDECRGSLVHLEPGSAYEAQLGIVGEAPTRKVEFATRAERVPVARTVRVPNGRRTLNITEGGTPEGYVVYDGQGSVIDLDGKDSYNVMVSASYVVVRGLRLRGAQQDAIRIVDHVSDVVIEDNDISGWGRQREKGGGHDLDSGIRAHCHSCPQVQRLVIQRNRIHDPRHGANSWSDGHPEGPQAITLSFCGGNHVIRNNEIFARNGNKFNDGIGGEDNFTLTGFPNADSDISDNLVSDAWDDGIEAEGGNRNVRIWGNRIDDTGIGIATTATTVGPVYLFRNVYDRSRFHGKKHPDQDDRQAFFKAGSDPVLGDGRRYIFHNTMLQSTVPGLSRPAGGGFGVVGTDNGPLNNTWSINNIYHLWKRGPPSYYVGKDNRFENDLNLADAGASHQAARDRGKRIPNFNDDFAGAAPDIGAQEAR
jgi:hypothetical protein